MFKNLAKQKREISFAGSSLLISIMLIMISVWSLQFLVVSLNNALTEKEVNQSQIIKFDLEEFNKLGFKE
ncbi:MAG: hypothetical protein Q8L47_01520 [bacterium]|nr:hypothetical protein [bacterium]